MSQPTAQQVASGLREVLMDRCIVKINPMPIPLLDPEEWPIPIAVDDQGDTVVVRFFEGKHAFHFVVKEGLPDEGRKPPKGCLHPLYEGICMDPACEKHRERAISS